MEPMSQNKLSEHSIIGITDTRNIIVILFQESNA